MKEPFVAPEQQKSKAAVALKTAIVIMEKWHATPIQIQNTLRVSRSTCVKSKRSAVGLELDRDQMTRISLILNIHATLMTVFDNPVNAYGFTSMQNHGEFFNGNSPLEIISQGDMISLYETHRRISALQVI